MRTDDFPEKFEADVKNDLYGKKNKGETEASGMTGLGILVGVIGGFFVCVHVSETIASSPSSIFEVLLGGIVGWIAVILVSLMLDFFLSKPINKKLNKKIKQKKDDMEFSIKEYNDEFEKNVENLSKKFEESGSINEIVNLMVDKFEKYIINADRNTYVKTISAEFKFSIFNNRIFWSDIGLNDYDFERHRKKLLTTPLEQAAMARALAKKIYERISNKYSNDISGTKASIMVEYKYERGSYEDNYNYENCVLYVLKYTAPNGYYVEETEW